MHVSNRQPPLGHLDSKPSSKSNMLRGRNSATSADEQPHIGNYRLLKTIGKGNFAKVKLARHILTGKEVSTGPGAMAASPTVDAPAVVVGLFPKAAFCYQAEMRSEKRGVHRGIGPEEGGNRKEEADLNPDLSLVKEIIFFVSCAGSCKDH